MSTWLWYLVSRDQDTPEDSTIYQVDLVTEQAYLLWDKQWSLFIFMVIILRPALYSSRIKNDKLKQR